MRHGLQQQRHNWTSEADQKLIDAVQTYGIDNWQLGKKLQSFRFFSG